MLFKFLLFCYSFFWFYYLFSAVSVKWGKEKFTDVECNTEESPELFKAQLFALSGVAPDRQKVMITGAIIKVSFYRQQASKYVLHSFSLGV